MMNSHKTNVPVRMFLPSTSLRWRVRKSRGREGEEESGVGGREGGREDSYNGFFLKNTPFTS